MMKTKLMACVAAVLLAACATPTVKTQTEQWLPATNVGDFNADGRLAVKVEGKGSYANFDWAYQNQVQTINVNTPLGSTVGQLCEDAQGVLAVDSKGRIYQAGTAEELSEQLLGFALPVQYLHIWAAGQRVANQPYAISSDGKLQQFGWTISRTLSDTDTKALVLENDKLTLRLVFDEINRSHDAAAPNQCAARSL